MAKQIIAAPRGTVEHVVAHLKSYRILTELRTNLARATMLVRALLVLTNLEIAQQQTIKSVGSHPRHI